MATNASIDPQLRKNIEDQLERLLAQLEDIDGLKDELDAEEYDTMKQAGCTSVACCPTTTRACQGTAH